MKARAGVFKVLLLLAALCAGTANTNSLADERALGKGLVRDGAAVMEEKMSRETADKAELFMVHGKYADAYDQYSKEIAAHPEKISVTARMHRMVCSGKMLQWQRVVDDGNAIMNSREGGAQNRSKVLDRRGLAYAEMKKYDLACRDFQQETRLWPDSRKAFVQLVRIYNLLGKKTEAAAAQKKLDELDKDFQPF